MINIYYVLEENIETPVVQYFQFKSFIQKLDIRNINFLLVLVDFLK